MRSPQGLDQKRARSLNPNTTRRFYENLLQLYEEHQYKECQIWNLDESGAMANKNGLARVLARRGARGVQSIVPDSREWITVLTCVNAAGHFLPNFYIFKGVRNTKNYTCLCEPGATQGLQKKGWMDTYNFSCWMDHFTFLKEKKGVLSPSMRHLIILDGYKSHVSLEVLEKARRKGVDMLSLPSHTSHGLQPLDVSCFGPFKHSFRAFRNSWRIQHPTEKVKKEILAQWMSLAIQQSLTPSNIKSGFKACGIWPLNSKAMSGKMAPSQVFPSEVPLEVQVEEILERGGLPSTAEDGRTHYYANTEVATFEEQPYHVDLDGGSSPQEAAAVEDSRNYTHFLRLPQEPPRRSNGNHEPLVDYSQSHILTSNEHVDNLHRITKNKETITKKKAEKALAKETRKRQRAHEKELERIAKEKRAKERDMARREAMFEKEQNRNFRAADIESEKRNKEIWTHDVVEEYGENLQAFMKQGDKDVPSYIDYIP